MSKSWTYDQITDEAEAQIKQHMRDAETSGESDRKMYRDWAAGAYLLWHSLTIGAHEQGADEKMKALMKFKSLNQGSKDE